MDSGLDSQQREWKVGGSQGLRRGGRLQRLLPVACLRILPGQFAHSLCIFRIQTNVLSQSPGGPPGLIGPIVGVGQQPPQGGIGGITHDQRLDEVYDDIRLVLRPCHQSLEPSRLVQRTRGALRIAHQADDTHRDSAGRRQPGPPQRTRESQREEHGFRCHFSRGAVRASSTRETASAVRSLRIANSRAKVNRVTIQSPVSEKLCSIFSGGSLSRAARLAAARSNSPWASHSAPNINSRRASSVPWASAASRSRWALISKAGLFRLVGTGRLGHRDAGTAPG